MNHLNGTMGRWDYGTFSPFLNKGWLHLALCFKHLPSRTDWVDRPAWVQLTASPWYCWMTYRGGNSHPRPSVLCVAWVFTSKPELSSTPPEFYSSKPESSFTFFKDTSDDSIFPILINFFILPFLKIPIFWLCAFSLPFPLHFSLHLLKPQAREKSPSLSENGGIFGMKNLVVSKIFCIFVR